MWEWLQVKDAQAATRFDAYAALTLLHKMLRSSNPQQDCPFPQEGHSPTKAATSLQQARSLGSATTQEGSTPTRKSSFSRGGRRPSFGKKDSSQLWPCLPSASLKHCKVPPPPPHHFHCLPAFLLPLNLSHHPLSRHGNIPYCLEQTGNSLLPSTAFCYRA